MNGREEMEGLNGTNDPIAPRAGNGTIAGPSGLAERIKKISLESEYMYPAAAPPVLPFETSYSSLRARMPPAPGAWHTGAGAGAASSTTGSGKGKERASDAHVNGPAIGDGQADVMMERDRVGIVKREEFVRVVLQALRDVGYSQTAEVLEAESGYEQETAQITALRAAIEGARWSEAMRLLEQLGVIKDVDKTALRRSSSSASMRGQAIATSGNGGLSVERHGLEPHGPSLASSAPTGGSTLAALSRRTSTDGMQVDEGPGSLSPHRRPSSHTQANDTTKESSGRQALFMILQQKYLELLEANQTKRALAVLRTELAPLAAHTERLHMLSGYIMCLNKEQLYARAGWDGAAGQSRGLLLRDLQALMRPGLMLPPRRLANLFDQARKQQETLCLYHSRTDLTSLLTDHQCQRTAFPSVSTHVLADHQDEVWVIEWSHDGQYIASGGKDSNVIIWKIGSAPARHCKNFLTLKAMPDNVTGLAWSPDDSRILVAADTSLTLWDTKTGLQVADINSLHKDVVSAVKWLPGKTGFVSAGMDMKLMFWTWEGALVRTWPTAPLRIHDFVTTPDSKRVIAIAFLNESKPDGRGAKPVASRSPERVVPDGLGLGGQPIAIGKMDRHIVIYDFDTGKIVSRRNVPVELTGITLSEDRKNILLSCAPDELQLWNIEDDALTFLRKYTGHQHRHFHLRSCFGGRARNFVVSGSEDSLVYVWHRESAALLEVLEGHSSPVNSVAWNPVYPDIFASCSDDMTVRIWQPPSVADAIAEEAVGPVSMTPIPSWGSNGGSLPSTDSVLPMPHGMDLVL